ncbi:MAG: hypothetical protein VX367_10850, partial [SAR324 cluster bacterium]|nr:hypothetical protein [SAR324 cluster bacterium]
MRDLIVVLVFKLFFRCFQGGKTKTTPSQADCPITRGEDCQVEREKSGSVEVENDHPLNHLLEANHASKSNDQDEDDDGGGDDADDDDGGGDDADDDDDDDADVPSASSNIDTQSELCSSQVKEKNLTWNNDPALAPKPITTNSQRRKASEDSIIEAIPQFNCRRETTLTRDRIKDLVVFGQMDRKFILAGLASDPASDPASDLTSSST